MEWVAVGLAIAGFFALAFYMLRLNHKETMAKIDRGQFDISNDSATSISTYIASEDVTGIAIDSLKATIKTKNGSTIRLEWALIQRLVDIKEHQTNFDQKREVKGFGGTGC